MHLTHQFRKIQPGKFAIVFSGQSIICAGGIFCREKAVFPNTFPGNIHSRAKPILFVLLDAFERMSSVYPRLTVTEILTLGAKSQIGTNVIQAIAVHVVNIDPARSGNNKSMHTHVARISALSINQTKSWTGMPLKSADQCFVFIVYDGEIALSQQNLDYHSGGPDHLPVGNDGLDTCGPTK